MYKIDSPIISVTPSGAESGSGRRAVVSLSDRDQARPVTSEPPQADRKVGRSVELHGTVQLR
jgi:hypothetical protein